MALKELLVGHKEMTEAVALEMLRSLDSFSKGTMNSCAGNSWKVITTRCMDIVGYTQFHAFADYIDWKMTLILNAEYHLHFNESLVNWYFETHYLSCSWTFLACMLLTIWIEWGSPEASCDQHYSWPIWWLWQCLNWTSKLGNILLCC